MNAAASYQLALTLESLIDAQTPALVIEALAQVCYEKADYVAAGGSHGGPSPTLARQWRSVATALEKAATKALAL